MARELTMHKWLLHVSAGLPVFMFFLTILPVIASEPVDKPTIAALIKALDSDSAERMEVTAALKEIGEPAIPLLLKAISDVNEKSDIRVRAIRVLTDIDRSSPETVHALIKVLEDDDHMVSRRVAIALGVFGQYSEEAIAALIQAMGHEKEYMRRSAIRGLPVARYLAVPALVEALNNGNEWQRVGSVEALADIKSELDMLLDLAHEDANEAERDEVINVLAEAAPIMIGLLNHDDPDVRAGAARGLGLIGNPARESVPMLVEALDDENGDVRFEAARALELIGEGSEDAAPRLIELLNNHNEHGQVRYRAARALGIVGKGSKEVVHELIDALDDGLIHASVPYGAVWALGEAGDAEATPALIDLIENNELHSDISEALLKIGKPATPALAGALKYDERQETRKRVAKVLAEMGEPASYAIPALVDVISDVNENSAVRNASINALGRIGEQALPAIIKLLGNEDRDVHGAAIQALGKVGKPALPVLVELLEDESELTRAGAVAALGDLGHSNKDIIPDPIIPALIEALDDGDSNVRSSAALALAGLRRAAKEEIPGFNEAIPALARAFRDEDENVRESAARALTRIGGAPVELLPGLVRDIEGEDDNARRRAVWVLGGMDEEGVKVLIKTLRRPAQNEEDRWIYSRSFRNALMRKRHYEFAVSSLVAAMDSEDERSRVRATIYLWWTYEGLNRLGEQTFTEKAVPILLQGLKHEDVDIREFATITLGEMVAGRYFSGDIIDGALDINPSLMKDIISAFIEALSDRDERVRGRAIGAFNYIGSPARDAIPVVIELIGHGEHPGAVGALGRIGKSDKKVVATLVEMLDDRGRGSEFRVSIIESLRGMLWDDSSLSEDILPVLIGLLDDADVEVRARAATRLHGEEYAERTVPALIRALEDEASIVRSQAAHRLGRIGENARQAAPALIKAMEDEDEDVCRQAIIAFQRIKAPEAVPALIKKLSDDNPKMREYAIYSLKYIDTPEAREAVRNYSNSIRQKK